MVLLRLFNDAVCHGQSIVKLKLVLACHVLQTAAPGE